MRITRNTDAQKLFELVVDWANDKGLYDPKAQLNKVVEEVGEIAHEINRNRDGDELEDAIGDTMVTLIILAYLTGNNPTRCLAQAYKQIRKRNGKIVDGCFVREE